MLWRIFSHCQLAWQPPPIEVNLQCYYCGTVHGKLQLHVYDACPAYYVLQLAQFVRCILDSVLIQKCHVLDGQVFIREGGPYVLRYLPETCDPPAHTQVDLPEVTVTHAGLLHVTPRYTIPQQAQKLVPTVVQGLVGEVPSIEHALQQWQGLGAVINPVA